MSVEMNDSLSLSFNASIAVTELLMKTLENVSKELASRCVRECGVKYNFDSEEAIRSLGLENLSLIRKAMTKKSGPSAKKDKTVPAAKEKKPLIPLPFTATSVCEVNCKGLAFNRGLFTQCQRKHMENGEFCSSCQAEADKNTSGYPDCGTVHQRIATGLYDFKDSKGRSPIRYAKLLEKLQVSHESALTEAGKFNVEIEEEHFRIEQNVKAKEASGPRGRPKKQTTVVEANNVEDLFAELAAEAEEDQEITDELEEKPARSSKKLKLTEQQKEARKVEIENERILKKQEREAKLAQEKAEREAKRVAEVEQRKAEREAKLAQEKAEREAKLALEKAEREAKRAAEAEQKKQEKEALKATKKVSKDANKDKSSVKTTNTASAPAAPAAVTAPVPAKVSVTRIQIDGVSYLKSAANILYNPETKEEVGLYDPATKTMKPLPEEEEDLEDEEYESDDE